ncbi:MAG: type II toxin-antitoxin system HipA family toxin [Thermomicrobiales bacterium]|nr:MAG: type II toxin-antitoxin system HipA family toxin [Thermomicrobiales bacterium]
MSVGIPDTVTVEIDAAEFGGHLAIGALTRNQATGGSIIGFAYADAWLDRPDRFALDPLHGLYPGDQWPRDGQVDRIFTDSSTDRWGRTLMDRQEVVLARKAGRPRHRLDEWDYLLGVSDVARMGALRFRTEEGLYLDESSGVPPMAGLPELAAAAKSIEQPDRDASKEAHALAILLAPGSSLGGARPKASFRDDHGSLWMAKFPSRTDARDMAACEWVLNELAAAAAIEVPEHRLLSLGRGHRTFAAKRFDRIDDSRRMYASAMTMVSRRDREPASYLDIALAISDHGATGSIESSLAKLFRRVAFNILTAHRDDHLRNHGFLRARGGWQLAPAFDLNPMPDKPEHELAIDADDHTGDIELLVQTAEYYRLPTADAEQIVDEVRDALGTWKAVAKAANVGALEMDAIDEAIAT